MALTPVNRQEEWYQQMINASTGNYLPSITAQDAGKVMTVESDGSWGVENVPSELPSVTSADETKVLTVDSNGDWVAADAPSASDIYLVNATFAQDQGEWSVTLDKTFAEISDASNADKIVLCIPYESANGSTGYPCVMTVESNEAFATTDVNAESVVYSFDFGVDSNDDTYVTETTWSKSGGGVLVVNVTPSDNTMVLDKTWQEIKDADAVSVVFDDAEENARNFFFCTAVFERVPFGVGDTQYVVMVGDFGNEQITKFIASSASGYPSYTVE